MAPVEPESLAVLRPGTSVLPAAPELPAGLSRLLDEWAPASDDRGVRLQKMLAGFQSAGYVSHGLEEESLSRSGHAIDRLEELANERPMIGDGEQYAVAAALMAREIGFPARVVVGYLPTPTTRCPPPASRRRSTAGTCRRGSRCRPRMARGCRSIRTPNCVRSPNASPTSPRSSHARSPPCRRRPSGRPWTTSTPIPTSRSTSATTARAVGRRPARGADRRRFVILGLALLISPFLAIIVAKLRRRRLRRRAPTAVERIEGGWQEFADTAADFGYPIRSNATRAEQAATVGGLAPLVLASVVDRAVYAPDGPTDGDDLRVWDTVDELQERLGAPRSRRERLVAAISLTSLSGYAVSRRGAKS